MPRGSPKLKGNKMGTVICRHKEVINSRTHIGTCGNCGQEKFYDPKKPGTFIVIKRGYLGGKVTDVTPPKKAALVPAGANPASFKHANWDQLNRFQKSKIYEENKALIIETVEKLGVAKGIRKLDIPSATWLRLRRRWEYQAPPRKGIKKSTVTHRAAPQVTLPIKITILIEEV